MQALTPSAGRPWPLGATVDAQGVNFAVFSAHATAVELCLYDPRGEAEVQRAPLVRSGDLSPMRWVDSLSLSAAKLVPDLDAGTLRAGARADITVIDPERRYVHEMWHASRKKSDVIVAEGYSKNDLHGSGVGEGGERAYGGSAIAGLVRRRELSMGIRHALAMALPRTHLKLGPIWPATKQDDGAETTYRGTIPMGQLVTLAPKTNIGQLGLSPEGRAVAEALRDYGAYVVDASSDLTLYAEPSAEPDLTRLRQDLPKLRMLLRCVQNASREAVGGPGTRLAPSAPALRPPLPPPATFAPSGKPAAKSAKPAKSAATAPKGTARQ